MITVMLTSDFVSRNIRGIDVLYRRIEHNNIARIDIKINGDTSVATCSIGDNEDLLIDKIFDNHMKLVRAKEIAEKKRLKKLKTRL